MEDKNVVRLSDRYKAYEVQTQWSNEYEHSSSPQLGQTEVTVLVVLSETVGIFANSLYRRLALPAHNDSHGRQRSQ